MEIHTITTKIDSFEGLQNGQKLLRFSEFEGDVSWGVSEYRETWVFQKNYICFTITDEEFAKAVSSSYYFELSADKNSVTITPKPGRQKEIIDTLDQNPLNNLVVARHNAKQAALHNAHTTATNNHSEADDCHEIETLNTLYCCEMMRELVKATSNTHTHSLSVGYIQELKHYEQMAHFFLNEFIPVSEEGEAVVENFQTTLGQVVSPHFIRVNEWKEIILPALRALDIKPTSQNWESIAQGLVKDILWANRTVIFRPWTSQLSVVEEDGNLKITARCVSNLTYSGNVIAEFVGREQKEFIVAKDPVEGTIVSALNQDGVTITAPEPVEGQ